MAVMDSDGKANGRRWEEALPLPLNLLIMLAALLGLVIVLNYAGIRALVERWNSDSNYGHGYLIPFISLYFVWARKDDLARMRPTPCIWGLPIFLLALPFTFLSMAVSSAVGSGIALVMMVNGLLLYLGGWKIYRILWLPAAYLIFMVPLPQGVHQLIANPLQNFASWASANILEGLFGVPTGRDGNIIRLAGHTLQVAEACSGMRSIMGLLALGVAFAYFWQRPLWERLFLIVSTIPIAILANICRVTGTGLLYDKGYQEFAQGFYHEFTGWFVFIFAMALFLTEAWVFSKVFIYEEASPETSSGNSGGQGATA